LDALENAKNRQIALKKFFYINEALSASPNYSLGVLTDFNGLLRKKVEIGFFGPFDRLAVSSCTPAVHLSLLKSVLQPRSRIGGRIYSSRRDNLLILKSQM
jgi:hypothetical protein